MRLIFIRHAEPDYEHDSLTEKGLARGKAAGCPHEKLAGR